MCEGIVNVDASEIEITPTMIEAGAEVLGIYDPREDGIVEWAEEIYRAMAAAKNRRDS